MGCVYICRVCKSCGKILPLIAYSVRKQGKFGRHSQCKECIKNKSKKYTKICEFCGKEYITSHKNSKYCSKKCSAHTHKITHYEFINKLNTINPHVEVIGEFINMNTNVLCKCNIHDKTWEANPISLLKGSGCYECGIDKIKQNNSKTHEQFIEEVKNINPNITILGQYKNDKIKVLVKCNDCGNEWLAYPSNILQGHGCKKCYLKNNRGENHPTYNHNLTDEEREKGRKYTEYYEWRKQVFERDNYTCQCCGDHGVYLVAHHKNGYNWDKEHRTDVDNGVTLCEDCHKEFHEIYGKGNNTEEQYIEFLINRYLGDVI